MHKIIYKAGLLILLSLFLSSCYEEQEPTLNLISESELSFSPGGGTAEILFTAGAEWSITPEGAMKSWCSLSELSGAAGDQAVTLTVDPVTGEEERSGILTLDSGNQFLEITVSQLWGRWIRLELTHSAKKLYSPEWLGNEPTGKVYWNYDTETSSENYVEKISHEFDGEDQKVTVFDMTDVYYFKIKKIGAISSFVVSYN